MLYTIIIIIIIIIFIEPATAAASNEMSYTVTDQITTSINLAVSSLSTFTTPSNTIQTAVTSYSISITSSTTTTGSTVPAVISTVLILLVVSILVIIIVSVLMYKRRKRLTLQVSTGGDGNHDTSTMRKDKEGVSNNPSYQPQGIHMHTNTVYREIYTSLYFCESVKLKFLQNKFLRILNLKPRPCITSTIQLRMRVHVVHIFTI